MTGPGEVAAAALAGLSTASAVVAALGALRPRDPYSRMHYTTIVSSLSGPLLALATVASCGFGATAATVVATVLALAFTNPVLTTAIAELCARDRDWAGIGPPDERNSS
ncbi:monovalent cation/H(+) antiporter subunit G [Nocardia sp. BMG111209]|uniref:monovalent cation/H(+) antiporter subunit G n=1 Tax=Nocardia sp. BMG111209 TaxID=1160137 RepID=UPI00035CB443|nr:monovalent cation/H(+) antiporter subunit G [Nocardia sp. BMG111209]